MSLLISALCAIFNCIYLAGYVGLKIYRPDLDSPYSAGYTQAVVGMFHFKPFYVIEVMK